jgi:hypothetical protein
VVAVRKTVTGEPTVQPAVTHSDPDVTAAVADFRDTVIAIRGHSLRLFYLPEGSVERSDEQAVVDDLVGEMSARCERLGITVDDLFRFINADLATSGGTASRPTGEYLHALTREATRAHEAEAAAYADVTAALERVKTATNERLAADRACAGYAADWTAR